MVGADILQETGWKQTSTVHGLLKMEGSIAFYKIMLEWKQFLADSSRLHASDRVLGAGYIHLTG